ncbi:MAG: ThiF family adenylyltransferase [Planctomycetes bacterium]|nr:ThiF family adenylyltransferase [Planctomycetota bacterium]
MPRRICRRSGATTRRSTLTTSPPNRYSRQTRFAPIGPDGQARLAEAHVMIVGVGALGTHAADALARAGVGHLTLVDRDVVEVSNLQRQCLFDEEDARRARPKAIAAATALRRVNESIRVDADSEELSVERFDALADRPDLILDGTDNFAARMLINDLAIRDGVTWIYAAAVGSTGRAMTIVPGRTPCLRCLMPTPPPTAEVGTCESMGVLSTAITSVVSFQVTEALRWLCRGEFTRGVWVCDPWETIAELRMRHTAPDPNCDSCGRGELPALRTRAESATPLCGRNAVQVMPHATGGVDLRKLADGLGDWASSVECSHQLLRFQADDARFTVFRSGRALVFGTDDAGRARILYDRYVGL